MAMATVTVIVTKMKKIIDIHNHSMYGVDDGSNNLEMTKILFLNSRKQGISKIVLTPHVNSSVQLASRNDHVKKFKELKLLAQENDIELILGAEIYIGQRIPEINFEEYAYGTKKTLLLEFSPVNKTDILNHVYNLKHKGFNIIIAHVERYRYLNIEDIYDLRNLGILLQVNASSILKKRGSKTLKYVKKLLTLNLIDFIASDAHNFSTRPMNLEEAYKKITKFYGIDVSERLFRENQEKFLFQN